MTAHSFESKYQKLQNWLGRPLADQELTGRSDRHTSDRTGRCRMKPPDSIVLLQKTEHRRNVCNKSEHTSESSEHKRGQRRQRVAETACPTAKGKLGTACRSLFIVPSVDSSTLTVDRLLVFSVHPQGSLLHLCSDRRLTVGQLKRCVRNLHCHTPPHFTGRRTISCSLDLVLTTQLTLLYFNEEWFQ